MKGYQKNVESKICNSDKENLENVKEVVAEFKQKLNTEVERQEKLDKIEERNFRRGELLEKYMVKILYKQNNGRSEEKYLRKLERK